MPPDYVVVHARGERFWRSASTCRPARSAAIRRRSPIPLVGTAPSGTRRVLRVRDRRAWRTGRAGQAAVQLVWFDRTGKRAGVIGAPDEDSLQYPELSNDGRRVAIDWTVQNNRDIYLVDPGRGPRRLTFDASVDATPVWSPDGGRIVFRSSRTVPYDLYQTSSGLEGAGDSPVRVARGEDPQRLVTGRAAPALHPPGCREPCNDIFVLPLEGGDGGRTPRPFVQTWSDESQAAFSPDGHWVAYQSNEGGPLKIYVQPFPGPGGKRQISTAGGASPRWRPDGRELFYLSPDATLMAAPIRRQGATLEPGATRCRSSRRRLTRPVQWRGGQHQTPIRRRRRRPLPDERHHGGNDLPDRDHPELAAQIAGGQRDSPACWPCAFRLWPLACLPV